MQTLQIVFDTKKLLADRGYMRVEDDEIIINIPSRSIENIGMIADILKEADFSETEIGSVYETIHEVAKVKAFKQYLK